MAGNRWWVLSRCEVRCKRGTFDAVRTRCRRDSDPDWTDLSLSVGTTLVDERPPAQPVGQWSDSVRVTLQP